MLEVNCKQRSGTWAGLIFDTQIVGLFAILQESYL